MEPAPGNRRPRPSLTQRISRPTTEPAAGGSPSPRDLTREGVLAALKARRVYATSGPRFVRTFPELAAGDYLYVRPVQIDGGTAWSSSFFIE